MKRRISEASSRLFVVIVMASVSILLTGGVWAAGGNLFWEDQSDKGQGKRVFAAGSGNISRPLQVAFAEAPVKPGGNPSGVGADCTNPPNIAPGADLVNCDLSLAPLRDAKLRGANLTGANLTGALMYNADLRDANLSGASLTAADLTGANLTKANLTKANLIIGKLRANLTGANLRDANLTGADLGFANLTGANLTGAILTSANMRGANLTGANVTDSRYGNTICPDGANSNADDGDGRTCRNNLM
ncbi:MAG: pentapeptide repeat-containing protein [Candidatus Methylomirabilales bacterium]